MKPIIAINSLTCRYADGTAALDRISLEIPEGSLTILAGCNASGKTTLIKHLNGLLVPDTGTVKIEGREVRRHLRWARQRVGMVFQDADSQIVAETVAAEVAFGPENLGLSHREIQSRVSAALEAVGLSSLAHRPAHRLSGGEKRRLVIAGVLAMQPRIMVLDEPFVSLDYPGTCQVLQVIERLKGSGHTLLVATHELEKILGAADRLIVLQAGRKVRDGIPADVVPGIEAFGIRPPGRSFSRQETWYWMA